MSFGIGIGDFLAVGELAWTLYREVYLVAQTAPKEVELLEKQLATLEGSLRIFREDFADANSIVQKAGPERLQIATDIVKGIQDTLLDLQAITTKYKKRFDPSRGKLKRGLDKVGFAITDAKEIDGIRSKLAYHNGLMNLLLTSSGNASLKRLEHSHSTIESGINKIMNHVGITSTPIMSKRPGMEDEVFNASLSANLLRYAEIEKPWASIGLFDWIQAGKWWLIRYQSEYEECSSDKNTLSLNTYLHLVKSAWILTDLIVVHPQRNHLDEPVAAQIEMLVKSITEEFERLDSRQTEIPSLDDIDEDDLRIWEMHEGSATLQPGQRRREGLRRWIMPNDLIIYQKFAKYKDANSSSEKSTTALVLLLVSKKSKQVRLIVHDQSWRCLAEYTDSALTENKTTISLCATDSNSVLFDSHSLTFSSQSDAEIFHGILVVESHSIKPYNVCFQKSSIQIHYAFYLLHSLIEKNRRLAEHFHAAKQSLPTTTLSKVELSFDAAVTQSATAFLGASDGISEPEESSQSKSVSDVLIRRVFSSGFSQIGRLLAALRKLELSDTMLESCLCPRIVLRERRTDVFCLLLESDFRIIYDCAEEAPDTLLSLAVSLGLVKEVKMIAEAHRRRNDLDVALRQTSKAGGLRTVLSWLAGNWNREIFDTLFAEYSVLPGNVEDKSRMLPLHWAAQNGQTDAVELLLPHTASNVMKKNVPGPHSRTPLHMAAMGGHEATVRLLLSNSDVWCDVDDIHRDTPLILACEAGHLGVVKILASHPGVDINMTSIYSSPLMGAALKGHSKIVEFLLGLPNIKPELTNAMGRTALSLAGHHGHEDIIKLLITRIQEKPDKDGRKLISHAAEKGYTGIVRLLAERDPTEVVHRDRSGQTPLHYAAKSNMDGSCVKYLLSLPNVDADAKMSQGATPLMFAVQAGNIEAVRLLVQRKDVDVNWRTNYRPYDRTALILAAVKPKAEIAQLLLQREDIDVNVRDKNSDATALHYAAVHSEGLEVLRMLVARGDADPTLENNYPRTPLDACIIEGWTDEQKEKKIELLKEALKAWEKRQQGPLADESQALETTVQTVDVCILETPGSVEAVIQGKKDNVVMVENAVPIDDGVAEIHITGKKRLTGTATHVTFAGMFQ